MKRSYRVVIERTVTTKYRQILDVEAPSPEAARVRAWRHGAEGNEPGEPVEETATSWDIVSLVRSGS